MNSLEKIVKVPNGMNQGYFTKLTSIGLKLFLISIYKIQQMEKCEEENEQDFVEFTFDEVVNVFGVSDKNSLRRNSSFIKDKLKDLEFCEFNDDYDDYISAFWRVKIFGGKIQLFPTPYMWQKTKLVAGYTKHECLELSQLKNKHAIRLYFVLKQYFNCVNMNSVEFEIEDLKRKLGVEKTSSYKSFNSFHQAVIVKALKDIAAHDLGIVIEKDIQKRRTEGRTISHLKFTFYRKEDKGYDLCKKNDYGIDFKSKLKKKITKPKAINDKPISEWKIQDFVDEYLKTKNPEVKEKCNLKCIELFGIGITPYLKATGYYD